MTALGAEVIPWGFKTECCGGGLTACRPGVGLDMTEKILDLDQDHDTKYLSNF